MKILITGATGFVGKELGKELVRRGHQVRVMSRNVHRARVVLPFPAEVISGRQGLPGQALDGVDAVINLAGENLSDKRWTKSQKEKIRDSRIKITSDLMRLVRTTNVRTVISASAIGYYGDRGDEVLTEESGPGSGFLPEVCRAWEAELFHGAEGMAEPPRLVAIRFGVVLGRSGGALQKLMPLFRRGLGGVVGSGKQYMSWIHIDDLVQLIVFALENQNVEGILNGVAPEPVDNYEFTRTLARVIGREARFPVPALLLRLAVGEMADVILSSQKVIPAKTQSLGFKFEHPSLEDSLRDINHEVKAGEEEFLFEQYVPLSAKEISKMFLHDETIKEIAPKISLFGKSCAKWDHSRKLMPLGKGTILQDRVIYRLPAGWLGQMGLAGSKAKKIKKLFKLQREIIDQKSRIA